MKRLRIIALVFLFITPFFMGNELAAQPVVHGDYIQPDSLVQQSIKKELFKPSVSVALGTSFSSFGMGNSAIGTYIAPEISMPVSEKLSVTFGMGYSNMFFNGPSEFAMQGNTSYGNLFVSATYQVDDKLTIRGTAYKTFMLNPSQNGQPLNSQTIDFSNQGLLFDAEYKISDKMKIGVSIEYRDQNQPSYFQNGNSNFGSSPFNTSPFGFGR
jgi:hypothetical protein